MTNDEFLRNDEIKITNHDGSPCNNSQLGESAFWEKNAGNGSGDGVLHEVGAGTSVGANYCEADNGVSMKDFRKGIGTCRKEARETKFFLRMIATAEPGLKDEARQLWREARELHLIFCAIWRK